MLAERTAVEGACAHGLVSQETLECQQLDDRKAVAFAVIEAACAPEPPRPPPGPTAPDRPPDAPS